MKHSNDIYTLLQNAILNDDPLINLYLMAPPKGTIENRVAIYADGFYSRLEETLLSNYQTLASFMGEDEFSTLSRNYVALYPSYSYSLNFLGQHLSRFLAETPPYHKKPYLAEIASYEWAETIAFTSADASLLNVTELQLLPANQWPDLTFYLHPSCQLLTMYWNSFSLIKASRDNQKHLPKPKKLRVPHSVMVWRRHLQIRYYELDNLELVMLEAIKNNASFIEICEHLVHYMNEEDVPAYLVQKLYVWLHEEVLVHKDFGG